MTELLAPVRARDGVAVIDLQGDLDASAEQALAGAYEAARKAGSIVLNFTGTGYINSTGIALIVQLLTRAREERVAVGAYGLTDHYRHIFEITRLSDFMTIADSEQEAVGAGG
jgi:anti-sigma B factor antagonist